MTLSIIVGALMQVIVSHGFLLSFFLVNIGFDSYFFYVFH